MPPSRQAVQPSRSATGGLWTKLFSLRRKAQHAIHGDVWPAVSLSTGEKTQRQRDARVVTIPTILAARPDHRGFRR